SKIDHRNYNRDIHVLLGNQFRNYLFEELNKLMLEIKTNKDDEKHTNFIKAFLDKISNSEYHYLLANKRLKLGTPLPHNIEDSPIPKDNRKLEAHRRFTDSNKKNGELEVHRRFTDS